MNISNDGGLTATVPDAGQNAQPRLATGARTSFAVRALALLIVGGLILAATAHNLNRTWERWGDIIYDAGREIDTPKQLAAGKTLYKDVRYWYGPLAPYTNAMLYRVFGVRLSVLTTAGIVSALLGAWLVYRTARLCTGRPVAVVTGIAFLYINAFGQYLSYNLFMFPLPYSYPATYGIVLALASVYFLLRHVRSGCACHFLLSCLFLAMTALCKVEVLFAAAATHAVFLVAWLLARRLTRTVYLVGYAGAVILPACVYLYFWSKVGSALLQDNLALPGNVLGMAFAKRYSGLEKPVENLRDMGWSAVGMAGCLVAILVATVGETRIRRDPTYDRSMRAIALVALGLACGAVAGGVCYFLGPYKAFRALPVLLILGFLACVVRFLGSPRTRVTAVEAMLLYVFGMAGLARLPLKAGAEHYGFYLLVPGLIAFAVLWGRHVPALLRRPTPPGPDPGTRPATPVAAALCVIGMLAGLAGTHAAKTGELLKAAERPPGLCRISTPCGNMTLPNVYKDTMEGLVAFLAGRPPQTTLVVLPEGSAITFLAGLTNPLGMHTFLPIDFSGRYDEAAVIRRLEETSPDYIAFVPRPVDEYGKVGFAVDYGKDVAAWAGISFQKPLAAWGGERYKPAAQQFKSKQYQIILLEKRKTPTTTRAAP